jgi:hypothetical protein
MDSKVMSRGQIKMRKKLDKLTIKVVERRMHPFSDLQGRRDMAGLPLSCIICNKPGGPFTVRLSMKVRNKPPGIGFACQECSKLPDRELIERATSRVAEQIRDQGGGGYTITVAPEPASDITSETLDAFLRAVSEMAELTMSKNKCVPANWIAVTRGGEMHVIPTPMETGDAAGKNRIADDMRLYFADQDVVRYAVVAEAWKASTGWPAGMQPSADPNRKPIVMIYAQDYSGALVAARDIIGDGGPDPTLGPLEIKVVEADNNGERFANLLPGQLPEPFTYAIKQYRLNGKPCGDPDKTWVQGDNPAEFPDELMAIQQPAGAPHVEVVIVNQCRVTGDNQIEMSSKVFSTRMRSFVIDRGSDRPIYESSTVDLRQLPIPASVLAVAAGPMVPNTENITVRLTAEEASQGIEEARKRNAEQSRRCGMN